MRVAIASFWSGSWPHVAMDLPREVIAFYRGFYAGRSDSRRTLHALRESPYPSSSPAGQAWAEGYLIGLMEFFEP